MSRRFEAEVASVESAVSRAPRARLLEVDRAGRRIAVELRVRTLVRRGGGTVSVEERAVATTFLLHVEHPRIPPLAVLHDAGVWNPHVADPARHAIGVAALCLGDFAPQRRLGEWVVAAYDVLRLARLALDQPLNPEAAAWVRSALAEPERFPTDRRGFFEADEGAAAAIRIGAPEGGR